MNPFVLIVGPTASGKSALGLRLAKRFDAAIMNCDSLQTYRRLDIGTAKPSREERELVPHFLFDELDPGQVLTAGDYRRLAMNVLERELPRRAVVGVGGSGFYIQALEKGMFALDKPKPEVEAEVRGEVEARGMKWAYEELERLDPEYWENINPNDSYRIVRGLVIVRDSGRKVSELRKEFSAREFPFPLLKLGLAPTREQLLPRIEARTREMLNSGFIHEVERLKSEGWSDWPPMHSVGYKEVMMYLKGELSLSALAPLIAEKTIQLAKKQKTWFKREKNIHWLDPEMPFPEAERLLQHALEAKMPSTT